MFVFHLAEKLGKTVFEIENDMGASELMEWLAFYQLKDEKHFNKVQQKISDEADDIEHNKQLRAFLSVMGNKNGVKRGIKN